MLGPLYNLYEATVIKENAGHFLPGIYKSNKQEQQHY
jgi:hypothetical protein